MKEKVLLWKNVSSTNENNVAMLVDPKEVRIVTDCENSFLIHNVEANPQELDEKLAQYIEEQEEKDEEFEFYHNETDDIEQFLKAIGFIDAEVEYAEQHEDIRDQLAYDYYNKIFYNLNDCESCKIYEYWDGSNHKTVYLEDGIEYEVEITKDCVDIDEWDGSKWRTGDNGYHQRIYKILTIDGKKEDEAYLLVYTSQWQGDYDTAEILYSIDAVRDHIEEIEDGLDRDIEQYMYKIGKLDGSYIAELVGMKEFAEIIGWEVAKLSTRLKRQQEGVISKYPLPEPIQVIAASPIWTKEQALDYKREIT